MDEARTLEHDGRDEAALDLYTRVFREGAGPDSALLVRMGTLQLRLGREDEAAASFARAAHGLEAEGLTNNAIALLWRVLRIRPGDLPALLRLVRLGDPAGYHEDVRDALGRWLEAVEEGDPGAVVESLRSHLRSLADDGEPLRAVLAQHLRAIGRVREAEELAPAAPPEGPVPEGTPERPTGGLDDLGVLGNEPIEATGGAEPPEIDLVPTRIVEEAPEEETVAPLEGLEPTRLEGLEPTSLAPGVGRDEPPETGADGPGEELPEDPGGDLPLLGLEPTAAPDPVDRAVDLGAYRERLARLRERGDAEELAVALTEAHPAFASAGRPAEAADLVGELLELRPEDLDLLARRVEYAFDAGEDFRSIEALLALGHRFGALSDAERARATFERVLDLDPENREAIGALESLSPPREGL